MILLGISINCPASSNAAAAKTTTLKNHRSCLTDMTSFSHIAHVPEWAMERCTQWNMHGSTKNGIIFLTRSFQFRKVLPLVFSYLCYLFGLQARSASTITTFGTVAMECRDRLNRTLVLVAH